ncbi:hypothetical protein ROHU_033321 [Labeo rohita]|uniref:Uncharacterized protein n=1 Tax=Labeo rohita TaxID=84645 RepID=A0A498LBL8_LABRO|nr:hypothetical protein ROHU_033321 [Labeo rohita]
MLIFREQDDLAVTRSSVTRVVEVRHKRPPEPRGHVIVDQRHQRTKSDAQMKDSSISFLKLVPQMTKRDPLTALRRARGRNERIMGD